MRARRNHASNAAAPMSSRPSVVHTGPRTGAATRMNMYDAPQMAASATSRATSPVRTFACRLARADAGVAALAVEKSRAALRFHSRLSLVILASPQPHDRLDLHLHAGNRELAHADEGARRARRAEVLLAHGVDLAAVVHVEEIDRHLEDVGEARARGLEHELHVAEHLAGLLGDVVAADHRAFRVGRRHAGDEQQI